MYYVLFNMWIVVYGCATKYNAYNYWLLYHSKQGKSEINNNQKKPIRSIGYIYF